MRTHWSGGARSSQAFATLFLLTLSLAGAAPASAYQTNKTSTGIEMRWRQSHMPVNFYLDLAGFSTLPRAGVEAAVKAAFKAWKEVSCSFITFKFGGTGTHGTSSADGKNVFSFPSSWTHQPQTVSWTMLQYDGTSGRIVDVDVEFNRGVKWSLNPTVGSRALDFQSVATAAAGRVLGLAQSSVAGAVMNGSFQTEDTSKRTLTKDDRNGVCHLYRKACSKDSDCGAGRVCIAGKCVDVTIVVEGSPCNDQDQQCDKGFKCLKPAGATAGLCREMCNPANPLCGTLYRGCVRDGTSGLCVPTSVQSEGDECDGSLKTCPPNMICMAGPGEPKRHCREKCDTSNPVCSWPKRTCYPSGTGTIGACITSNGPGEGTPCKPSTGCDYFLLCIVPKGSASGICRRACKSDQACATGQLCADTTLAGACLPKAQVVDKGVACNQKSEFCRFPSLFCLAGLIAKNVGYCVSRCDPQSPFCPGAEKCRQHSSGKHICYCKDDSECRPPSLVCRKSSCVTCTPVTEVCNGNDDDCDGTVDNGSPCPAGQSCIGGKCVSLPVEPVAEGSYETDGEDPGEGDAGDVDGGEGGSPGTEEIPFAPDSPDGPDGPVGADHGADAGEADGMGTEPSHEPVDGGFVELEPADHQGSPVDKSFGEMGRGIPETSGTPANAGCDCSASGGLGRAGGLLLVLLVAVVPLLRRRGVGRAR